MKRNKKVWGAVGVVAVVGAVAMLLAGGLKDGVVYFLTPGEVVAQGTDAVDRPLRLGGQVKPGSVEWDAEALDLRFVVQDSVGEVPVASTGAPPAMFRDGIGVVVIAPGRRNVRVDEPDGEALQRVPGATRRLGAVGGDVRVADPPGSRGVAQ